MLNILRGQIKMKIYKEISLKDFDFWSGAIDTIKFLNDDDLLNIELTLEELYPEGLEETEVNDIFWFERDMLAQWLGYQDWEDLEEDRQEE